MPVPPIAGKTPQTPKPNIFLHVMKRHSASSMAPLNGDRAAFIAGMRNYLVAVLSDPEIPSDEWISLGSVGAAIREYIHDGTELRELLGTYFWKWCLKTAEESGINATVDDVHQNLRVTRSDTFSPV